MVKKSMKNKKKVDLPEFLADQPYIYNVMQGRN